MSETLTRKYFGTDGIRGAANDLLTAELALSLGKAAVSALKAERSRILIGRDTRLSGPMLEAALLAGISAAGGEPVLAGIVPTPAVASLVLAGGFDAGAVISASHNPYRDNGIKFFGNSGFKLTDAQEAEIEDFLTSGNSREDDATEPGEVRSMDDACQAYVDRLLSHFRLDLSGIKIVIDCANGATYKTSPMALRSLGADLTVLCDRPDGRNINDGCGSTAIGLLQAEVIARGADLGLAFDGDGDRVLAVDASGHLIDGDFILAICARHLKEQGKLAKDTIVTTVMTNLGFRLAMEKIGISVKTTAVGDRYVLEQMLEGGYRFGGEQSGHIINLDAGTTGDGLATSFMLLQVMNETGSDLTTLARVMTRLPQKLVNVAVPRVSDLAEATEVWRLVEQESARLDGSGRVLLRPSGTEPLIRVMVEAESMEICDQVAGRLAAAVKAALG